MIYRMILMGISMLVVALPIFYFSGYNRSLTLLVLSVLQWFNVLNVRSEKTSVFKLTLKNNRFLIGAIALVFFLQIFAIQTPWGNSFLHTKPLPLSLWFLAFLASSLIVWVEEGRKYLLRRR